MLSTSFSLPAGFDFEGTTLLVGIGQGDPTTRRAPGRLSKAVWLHGELSAIDLERRDATVVARAEGPGAELLLREAPAILGLHETIRPRSCHATS